MTTPTTAGERKHWQPTTRRPDYDTGYQGLPDQPSRANHLGNTQGRKEEAATRGIRTEVHKDSDSDGQDQLRRHHLLQASVIQTSVNQKPGAKLPPCTIRSNSLRKC